MVAWRPKWWGGKGRVTAGGPSGGWGGMGPAAGAVHRSVTCESHHLLVKTRPGVPPSGRAARGPGGCVHVCVGTELSCAASSASLLNSHHAHPCRTRRRRVERSVVVRATRHACAAYPGQLERGPRKPEVLHSLMQEVNHFAIAGFGDWSYVGYTPAGSHKHRSRGRMPRQETWATTRRAP